MHAGTHTRAGGARGTVSTPVSTETPGPRGSPRVPRSPHLVSTSCSQNTAPRLTPKDQGDTFLASEPPRWLRHTMWLFFTRTSHATNHRGRGVAPNTNSCPVPPPAQRSLCLTLAPVHICALLGLRTTPPLSSLNPYQALKLTLLALAGLRPTRTRAPPT